jgi:glyoxylase-like metal-dependent hydrolase (beta-lactamase superfamily II)
MSARLQIRVVPVTPFQQNCSVLWCPETGRGAVVDPGGDLDRILAVVETEKVSLEKILITHGHLDHAAATAELGKRLGLPIEGPHREDKFWIDQLPQAAAQYGFPPCVPFSPTRWLDQDDVVTVGGLSLQVLHCPGHTPGHVVFFDPAHRLAIVGDVIFAGSIGRSDFPRGDHAALIESIRKKLFALGDDVTFVPGHGPTSTFGAERRSNPFVADRLFATQRAPRA